MCFCVVSLLESVTFKEMKGRNGYQLYIRTGCFLYPPYPLVFAQTSEFVLSMVKSKLSDTQLFSNSCVYLSELAAISQNQLSCMENHFCQERTLPNSDLVSFNQSFDHSQNQKHETGQNFEIVYKLLGKKCKF